MKHTSVQFPSLLNRQVLIERMSRPLKLALVLIVLLTCVHIGAVQDDGKSLYLIQQSNSLMFCVGARLSAAVHEILLPIMKEIKNDLNSLKDDLNSVKNDFNSFNKTVSSLSGDLEDYKQQTASQLSQLTTTVDQLDSK